MHLNYNHYTERSRTNRPLVNKYSVNWGFKTKKIPATCQVKVLQNCYRSGKTAVFPADIWYNKVNIMLKGREIISNLKLWPLVFFQPIDLCCYIIKIVAVFLRYVPSQSKYPHLHTYSGLFCSLLYKAIKNGQEAS